MKKTIENKRKYTNGPKDLPDVNDLMFVKDTLPSPKALTFKKSKGIKVTITLDTSSVEFFKQQAEKFQTPYQRMIRNLLNHYAQTHQKK